MSKKATISKMYDSKKTVSHDAELRRFIERANHHMERAWMKIYGGARK